MRLFHVAAPVLSLFLSACIYAPQWDHEHHRHKASPHDRHAPGNTTPPPSPPPPPVTHPPADPGDDDDGEAELPPETEGREVELRLRGVGPGDYTEVLAMIHKVEVLIDGRPTRFELREEVINLANPAHAWLLGSFRLPDTITDVSVSIGFGPTAGTQSPTGPSAIDLRAGPMQFHAPAGHLRFNAHAVVELELQRSLVAGSEYPLLLPNFSVRY